MQKGAVTSYSLFRNASLYDTADSLKPRTTELSEEGGGDDVMNIFSHEILSGYNLCWNSNVVICTLKHSTLLLWNQTYSVLALS